MHSIVADRLHEEPATVIRHALKNLDRWHQQGVDCEDFEAWRKLLGGPSQAIINVLTGISEDAVRLRQSSPFAGLIPEEARHRILASAE